MKKEALIVTLICILSSLSSGCSYSKFIPPDATSDSPLSINQGYNNRSGKFSKKNYALLNESVEESLANINEEINYIKRELAKIKLSTDDGLSNKFESFKEYANSVKTNQDTIGIYVHAVIWFVTFFAGLSILGLFLILLKFKAIRDYLKQRIVDATRKDINSTFMAELRKEDDLIRSSEKKLWIRILIHQHYFFTV